MGTGCPHPQREPYSGAARPQLGTEGSTPASRAHPHLSRRGSPPAGHEPSTTNSRVPTRGPRALNYARLSPHPRPGRPHSYTDRSPPASAGRALTQAAEHVASGGGEHDAQGDGAAGRGWWPGPGDPGTRWPLLRLQLQKAECQPERCPGTTRGRPTAGSPAPAAWRRPSWGSRRCRGAGRPRVVLGTRAARVCRPAWVIWGTRRPREGGVMCPGPPRGPRPIPQRWQKRRQAR